MATTLIWTGVALWLGFSAVVVFVRIPSARPVKVAARSARITHLDRYRA
jgi:hypothetical protein